MLVLLISTLIFFSYYIYLWVSALSFLYVISQVIFWNLHGTLFCLFLFLWHPQQPSCIYASIIARVESACCRLSSKFWVSFTASIVWARATFNNYWSVDIQLLLELPFNHKSWFIVAFLTIPLKCCLANQVHSLSWRTNLLQGCQNKSPW